MTVGGREGSVGDIRFALQGNILAGECVVDAIYNDVVDGISRGVDIPELLMIVLEVWCYLTVFSSARILLKLSRHDLHLKV